MSKIDAKKEAQRARTRPCRRAQRQPNINKIPSEKQQERKLTAENLSEEKLNELRRKTIGQKSREGVKKGGMQRWSAR